MKLLWAVLFLTLVIAQNDFEHNDDSDEYDDDDDFNFPSQLRITGGTKAKAKKVPSYVALQIYFDHGIKSCGGLLGPAANQIITAASCVFDYQEDKANKIQFAFGQSNNFKKNKIGFTDIWRVSTYDETKNTSADDLAMIILESSVITSTTIAVGTPDTQSTADIYLNQNLVVCGFGDIDNFRNRSDTLMCTTLLVVAAATCITPAPAGTICAKNVDGKNACGGDYGSPAYSNSTGSLVPVAVVSYFPDTRGSARCQDGHMVVLTQLGNYASFIASPTTIGANSQG